MKNNTTSPNTDFELPFWQNHEIVAGVDEAGRGPLAGPVVAAAVILPSFIESTIGFNDSKQLNEKQRNELFKILTTIAVESSVAFVDSETIEKINIRCATLLAMQTSINSLENKINHIFIDGNYFEYEKINYSTIIKGDSKVLSIAAASIVAKVTRDRWMVEVADVKYPNYGFARHKGYGTREHIQAIVKYGICPLHRKTFFRNIISQNPQIILI